MSSSILCRQCNKPITFDNKHISQRTGKKIPLDVETKERHDCPARRSTQQQQQQVELQPEIRHTEQQQPYQQQQSQQRQRQYLQCNKGCGNEIYFHPDQRTETGKWIPLERDTGKPHQCEQQWN